MGHVCIEGLMLFPEKLPHKMYGNQSIPWILYIFQDLTLMICLIRRKLLWKLMPQGYDVTTYKESGGGSKTKYKYKVRFQDKGSFDRKQAEVCVWEWAAERMLFSWGVSENCRPLPSHLTVKARNSPAFTAVGKAWVNKCQRESGQWWLRVLKADVSVFPQVTMCPFWWSELRIWLKEGTRCSTASVTVFLQELQVEKRKGQCRENENKGKTRH